MYGVQVGDSALYRFQLVHRTYDKDVLFSMDHAVNIAKGNVVADTQSSMGLHMRAKRAGRYQIPIVLPTGINKVTTLVTRCLFYDDDLPETADSIREDLSRYLKIDRKSPLFPCPRKTYTLVTSRL
jgi:hypothetical protein